MLTLVAIVMLVGCTDPHLQLCEDTRRDSFVLQPPFACRLQDFPEGGTIYPVPPGEFPGGGSGFLQPIAGTADVYAGPAQYDNDLKEPGVLVALPDGDCEWVPCHGGVPPIDGGTP